MVGSITLIYSINVIKSPKKSQLTPIWEKFFRTLASNSLTETNLLGVGQGCPGTPFHRKPGACLSIPSLAFPQYDPRIHFWRPYFKFFPPLQLESSILCSLFGAQSQFTVVSEMFGRFQDNLLETRSHCSQYSILKSYKYVTRPMSIISIRPLVDIYS